jgi:DNA recombination protein RmuC
MEIFIALIALCILVIFVSIFWIYRQTNTKIDAISAQLIEAKTLQGQTTESFGHIQSSLGRLTEASRHMEEVGKNIAGLSDILRAPKFRGGIGELLLGDLLSQILSPEHYKLQYSFSSGERVDAVIILKVGMVPVDAKFPLESFQRMIASSEGEIQKKHKREFTRAVKGHIDDVAQKYILPDEGTFDFALMYIPAENVYYETIIKDEGLGEERSLLSYALEKRVIPVSPNSFYAYLQAIALGLKGLQIEKRAQEIMQYLARIEGDFDRFKDEYDTLGGHIERARKKYDDASKSLGRFEDKLIGAQDPSRLLTPQDVKALKRDSEDD